MAKPMKMRDFQRALSLLGCTFRAGGKHTVVLRDGRQVGAYAGRHDEATDGVVQSFERKLGLKLREVLEQRPARTPERVSPAPTSAVDAEPGVADNLPIPGPPAAQTGNEAGETRPPNAELARKAAAFDRLVVLCKSDTMSVILRQDGDTVMVQFTDIVGSSIKRCVREGASLLAAVESTRPLG